MNMKREFIKSLNIEGLTDEIIDKIMSENGKDIQKAQQATEKVNTELENLKAELKSNKQTLDEANAQIEKFKGLDIEGKDKAIQEWQTKYADFETKSKAEKEAFEKQLAEKDYEFAVKEFTGQHKFTNDFVKDAFIENFKKQGFKLEEGKFLGADDYIKTFGEKNPGVFVVEEPSKDPVPQIVKPGGGQPPVDPNKGFNFNFHAIRPVPKE
jgi:hypothetical protein